MKKEELNIKMINYFPSLKDKYDDEVGWQEGDKTGSHTVYGDVLTPYLVEKINQDDKKEVTNIFNFLEEIFMLNDEYANDVLTVSVLESILSLIKENMELVKCMGTKSKTIVKRLLDSNI